MMQEPVATTVTVEPDTVQIEGLAELNATVRPDVAVADSANGAASMVWVPTAGKLMVWAVGVTTANDCGTWLAAT